MAVKKKNEGVPFSAHIVTINAVYILGRIKDVITDQKYPHWRVWVELFDEYKDCAVDARVELWIGDNDRLRSLAGAVPGHWIAAQGKLKHSHIQVRAFQLMQSVAPVLAPPGDIDPAAERKEFLFGFGDPDHDY